MISAVRLSSLSSRCIARSNYAINKANKAPAQYATKVARKHQNTTSAKYHNSTKTLSKETPKSQKDPHQVANDMVQSSPEARISGTEALNSITPQQKMRNYITALSLVTFCTGVWYYSIQSVGRPEGDGGMDELRAEAQEAREVRSRKELEERNAEELAQLDSVSVDGVGDDDVIVAVAADADIAQVEEDLLKGKKSGSGRPLWKKIVFFWRKE